MLLDVVTRTTLHQLAVDEGFVNNVGGVCMLGVGVNARYMCAGVLSLWPLRLT